MAGLESIALAVAHLEQERQAETSPKASPSSDETEDNKYPSSILSSPAMPPRHGFGEGQPRLVSSDCIYTGDHHSPTEPEPVLEASSPSATLKTNSPWSHLSAATTSPASSPTASTNLVTPTTPSLDTLLPIPEGTLPPPPPPSEIITQVLEHDVLCGRGGETNHHTGNIKYRQLVKCYQPLYIASKRRDKPRIAQTIVHLVRQNGGRFIKKQGNTWRDVGNTKAREKTSQALREGAPELRNPEKDEKSNPPPHPTTTMSSNTVPTTMMMASAPAHYLSTATSMNHLMAPPMSPPSHGFSSLPQAHGFSSLPQAPVLLSSAPPSMVERSDSTDSEISASGCKRPRRESSNLADLASCAAQLVEPLAAPSSCVATISASDEDCQEAPTAPIIRGPRLKRLKKRLEESHA
jgi:hypothetical protein